MIPVQGRTHLSWYWALLGHRMSPVRMHPGWGLASMLGSVIVWINENTGLFFFHIKEIPGIRCICEIFKVLKIGDYLKC